MKTDNLNPTVTQIKALALKIKPNIIPQLKENAVKGQPQILAGTNIPLTANVLEQIEKFHKKYNFNPSAAEIKALAYQINPKMIPQLKQKAHNNEFKIVKGNNILLTTPVVEQIEALHIKYNLNPSEVELKALALKIIPKDMPSLKEKVRKGEEYTFTTSTESKILVTENVLQKIMFETTDVGELSEEKGKKINSKPTLEEIKALALIIKPQQIEPMKESVKKGQNITLTNDNILLTEKVLQIIGEHHSFWQRHQQNSVKIEENLEKKVNGGPKGGPERERNTISNTRGSDGVLITEYKYNYKDEEINKNVSREEVLEQIEGCTLTQDHLIIEAICSKGSLDGLEIVNSSIQAQRSQNSFADLTEEEKNCLTALEEVIKEKIFSLGKNLVLYYNSVKLILAEEGKKEPRAWVNTFWQSIPSQASKENFSMTHTFSFTHHFPLIAEFISHIGSFKYLTKMAIKIKKELKQLQDNPHVCANYLLILDRITLRKAFLFNKLNDNYGQFEKIKIFQKSPWFTDLLEDANQLIGDNSELLVIELDSKSSELDSPSDLGSGTSTGRPSISDSSGSSTSTQDEIKGTLVKKTPRPPTTPNPHRNPKTLLPQGTSTTSLTGSSVETSSSSSNSNSGSSSISSTNTKQAILNRGKSLNLELSNSSPPSAGIIRKYESDAEKGERLAREAKEKHQVKTNVNQIASPGSSSNFNSIGPTGEGIRTRRSLLGTSGQTATNGKPPSIVSTGIGSLSDPSIFKKKVQNVDAILGQTPAQIKKREEERQSTSATIEHFNKPKAIKRNTGSLGSFTPAPDNSSSSSSSSSSTSSSPSTPTPTTRTPSN